jgi:hypothetical protein
MRAKVVGKGRLTGVVRKNVFPLSNSLLCKELMSNDLMPDQGTFGALGATRTNPSLRELLSSEASCFLPARCPVFDSVPQASPRTAASQAAGAVSN